MLPTPRGNRYFQGIFRLVEFFMTQLMRFHINLALILLAPIAPPVVHVPHDPPQRFAPSNRVMIEYESPDLN